jgi:hypothetical protein
MISRGKPNESGLNGRPTNQFAYVTVCRMWLSKRFLCSHMWPDDMANGILPFAIVSLQWEDLHSRANKVRSCDPSALVGWHRDAVRPSAGLLTSGGVGETASVSFLTPLAPMPKGDSESRAIKQRVLSTTFCIIEIRSRSSLNLRLQLYY